MAGFAASAWVLGHVFMIFSPVPVDEKNEEPGQKCQRSGKAEKPKRDISPKMRAVNLTHTAMHRQHGEITDENNDSSGCNTAGDGKVPCWTPVSSASEAAECSREIC
jgi:hypothetical protein